MNYALSEETKDCITSNITTESKPDRYYFVMVLLSCIIATYGLLSNSVAVIIGAMLVAPLMFPILKGAVAIAKGDNFLLKQALWAELSGVLIAIIFSILLTLFLPISTLSEEILSRTKPTLLDLIIAFASGLAGTVAICYRPSSAILPGVAIASALMPPLCVIGIGLAKQEYSIAGGAGLLFLSNMIAINAAAILVFKLLGFTADFFQIVNGELKKEKLPKRFIYPIVLLIIISIPLFFFMNKSISNTHIQNIFLSTVRESVTLLEPHSKVESLNFIKKEKFFEVDTKVRSVYEITPEDIRRIENKLEYKLEFPVKINMEIIPIQLVNNKNILAEKTKSEPLSNKAELIQEYTVTYPEYLIEKNILEKLYLFPGAKLNGFEYSYNDKTGIYYLNIEISTITPLDESFEATLKTVLENKLNRKIKLNINQIIIYEESDKKDNET